MSLKKHFAKSVSKPLMYLHIICLIVFLSLAIYSSWEGASEGTSCSHQYTTCTCDEKKSLLMKEKVSQLRKCLVKRLSA
jgi:hypothetical protein